MHEHLQRLGRVWVEWPIYFITICTKNRQKILTREPNAQILLEEWHSARERYHWAVGRYVIMPDHVHFFCRPEFESKTLSQFVGGWKTWTSRRLHEQRPQPTAAATEAVWQRGFFDHLLRSSESYAEKWHYVRDNPVRARLVASAGYWPHSGELERLEL